MKSYWPQSEDDMQTFKVQYITDVEIKCDELDRKAVISRTRQKIKRVVIDSPDDVKPTKIQIKSID